MDVEKVVSLILFKKKLGLRIIAVEAWGRQLVRPDDTGLVLLEVRPRGDTVVLLLGQLGEPDPRAGAFELVLERPGQPKFSDDAIEFPTATYLRFDEATLVLEGGTIHQRSRGSAETVFDPKGPALVLRRDPFAG